MEIPAVRKLRIAGLCNRLHGGPVISMWDVDDMDDETVDFLLAMAIDYPEMLKQATQSDASRMAWLRSHKTYKEFGLLVN